MSDVLISTPKDKAIKVSQYLLKQLLQCEGYHDNRDGSYTKYGFALKVTQLLEEQNNEEEI